MKILRPLNLSYPFVSYTFENEKITKRKLGFVSGHVMPIRECVFRPIGGVLRLANVGSVEVKHAALGDSSLILKSIANAGKFDQDYALSLCGTGITSAAPDTQVTKEDVQITNIVTHNPDGLIADLLKDAKARNLDALAHYISSLFDASQLLSSPPVQPSSKHHASMPQIDFNPTFKAKANTDSGIATAYRCYLWNRHWLAIELDDPVTFRKHVGIEEKTVTEAIELVRYRCGDLE